jgi:alpha-tubulin suppressor-like RCC1 family protein
VDTSALKNQKISQLFCGTHTSAFVTENGELWACGKNSCGMLGLGESYLGEIVSKFEKVDIKGIVTHVAMGTDHSLVVTNGKHVWSAGSNVFGELGTSAAFAQYEFERVTDLGDKKVRQIACGMRHSVLVTEDSQLYVTGNNLNGQLALGDNNNRNRFTHCLFTHNIKQVACGWFHTAIVTQNSELFVTGM